MFVPKEIAPYLGMIAPMVAPQLGIFGGMALSQLGSIKQHGGKLDPFSALSTGIALSSPQARAITFLKAPQYSAPKESVAAVNLSALVDNNFANSFANS